MACSDSLFVSLRTDKLGWESEPYVTHLLDGFSALSDPDHIIPLPVIFSPKVTSSPNLFSFLPLHQSDKLSPQIKFFSPTFLHNFRALSESKLLIKNVLSIQPFPTFPQNIKIVLNSNIHRFGKTFPNFATDDIIYIGPLILVLHCLFHLISQNSPKL